MNNKFLELATNPVLNTDNTIRYSLLYQVKEESLSNHIAEVGILSYILSLKLISLGEELDVGKVLEKVVLHDLDEVLTGDIPRSTKYYSKQGLEAMRQVAEDAITKLASSLEVNDDLVKKWKLAKDEKEGKILVLTDMLCVARKVVNEIKLLGNGYFLKVAYEMVDNLSELSEEDLSEFNEKSREYIQLLIHDTIEVMQSIVSSDDRLTRYGIINNVFSKVSK